MIKVDQKTVDLLDAVSAPGTDGVALPAARGARLKEIVHAAADKVAAEDASKAYALRVAEMKSKLDKFIETSGAHAFEVEESQAVIAELTSKLDRAKELAENRNEIIGSLANVVRLYTSG